MGKIELGKLTLLMSDCIEFTSVITRKLLEESDNLYLFPENGKHPLAQIEFAKFVAREINSGKRIIIATHSDYIVKEINNLLMLSNEFEGKEEFKKAFKFNENEYLNPKDVRAYLLHFDNVELVEIDEYGLMKTSLDNVIISINNESNTLISKIDKLKENE